MPTAPVLAVTLLVLATLAACDDPSTPGEDQDESGVQFVADDGRAFSASGDPAFSDGELSPADFAVAISDSVGGMVLASFQRTEGTRGDLFILQLIERRTGLHAACHSGGGDCHGRLLLGIDAANTQDVEERWELIGGDVTVDLLTADSVAGGFADFVYEGPGDGDEERRVAEGTFRLPLLDEAEGRAIMECFLKRVTGGACD